MVLVVHSDVEHHILATIDEVCTQTRTRYSFSEFLSASPSLQRKVKDAQALPSPFFFSVFFTPRCP